MTDQTSTPGDIARSVVSRLTESPTPAADAPGTTGAQPDTFGADQKASLAQISTLRQRYADPTLTSEQRNLIAQAIAKHQRFVFNNGEKPIGIGDEPDQKLPDLSEYDPLAAALREAHAKPVEVESLSKEYAVRGLDAEIARDVSSLAQVCGLPEAQARNLLGRALEIMSSKNGSGPMVEYPAATEADYEKAARSFKGGNAELEAKSERARRWLATKTGPTGKNVLEVLDKHGLTSSALALDAGLVVTLCAAADRDGIK